VDVLALNCVFDLNEICWVAQGAGAQRPESTDLGEGSMGRWPVQIRRKAGEPGEEDSNGRHGALGTRKEKVDRGIVFFRRAGCDDEGDIFRPSDVISGR